MRCSLQPRAAAAAAVMRVMGCHTVVFTALTCFAATGATIALVGTVTTIPLHALGAASAAISLILIEISAPISIRLSGLSPQPSSDSDEPMLNPDRVKIRAIDARTWLTSLVTAFSASTALGSDRRSGRPESERAVRAQPGIAFAALTGGVLLSRTRAHRNLAMSLPLIIFGTITVSVALVGAEAAYPTQSAYITTASIGLAAVALRLGFVNLSTEVSPIGQRGIELLEYLGLAAVLPLACWICGLYAAARGLNCREGRTVPCASLRNGGGRRRAAAVWRFSRLRGIAAADRPSAATAARTGKPAAAHSAARGLRSARHDPRRRTDWQQPTFGARSAAGLETHPRFRSTRRRHRHRCVTAPATIPYRGRR